MVEVFKTNVQDNIDAANLAKVLLGIFPHSKINFDLEDCDSILRIENTSVCIESVVFILQANGFVCEVLK
ncbi:MAG: hypothetical protein V4658_00815 [Bacteroidota bacterium]